MMCPVHERGDPRRRFIGGKNGLYRILKYQGGWKYGRRSGQGVVEYCDGTKIVGNFEDGFPKEEANVVFADGKKKWAEFGLSGSRLAWVEKGEREVRLHAAGKKGCPSSSCPHTAW